VGQCNIHWFFDEQRVQYQQNVYCQHGHCAHTSPEYHLLVKQFWLKPFWLSFQFLTTKAFAELFNELCGSKF
jgi:hypothetical protein